MWAKIKSLYKLAWLLEKFQGDYKMKSLGWVKIIGYVASLVSLGMGFVDPKTAIMIMGIISVVAKAADEIVKLTPSTKDDATVTAVVEALKNAGLVK